MLSLRQAVKKFLSFLLQALFLGAAETIKLSSFKGPVLVVAPHPDDETLGCGGVVLKLRAQKIPVRFVIVSDGGAASGPLVPKELARRRRVEAQKAATLLHVPETEIVFLSYPDGETRGQQKQIVKDLAAQIWLAGPQTIFAPYPQDKHEDHRVVGDCIRALVKMKKIQVPVYYYPMWFWPRAALSHLKHPFLLRRYRKIDVQEMLEEKAKAFACYETQLKGVGGEGQLDPELIKQHMGRYEYFIEGFSAP